jgi:peptidyl-prolyl cis-trans isomerase A (cyclophilin A)
MIRSLTVAGCHNLVLSGQNISSLTIAGNYFMRVFVITLLFSLGFSLHAGAQSSAAATPTNSGAKPSTATSVAPTSEVATAAPAPVLKPQVKFTTSMGEFVMELEPERAPKTVANFLAYVKVGQYKDTIFHRIIPGFMVQGGGYTKELGYKSTLDPIENEGNNGLSNLRGTVAMARLDDPSSATSQFFINVVDNKFLNYTGVDSSRAWGYCVFARVISGMEVIDKMRTVKTDSTMPGFADKPLEAILILNAELLSAAPEPAAAAPAPAPTPKK